MSEPLTDDRLKYTFSRDYELLWDLLHEGHRIVCFVDMYEHCRDVCTISLDDNGVNLGSRGVSHWAGPFSYKPKFDQFVKNLTECNLEFIDPELT